MIYTSEYFHGNYGKTKIENFLITDENIKRILMLKSSFEEKGSYYNHRIQWLLSDNLHVDNAEELSELFATMQFIVMTAGIKKDFLEKHPEIKDYHINMLRRLYLFYDDEEIAISMGFKRPFGNSHVLGDVREEMNECGAKIDPESHIYEVEDRELRIFIDMLDDYFRCGFDVEYRSFRYIGKDFNNRRSYGDVLSTEWGILNIPRPHPTLMDWRLDVSEVREKKINKILENK